MMFLNLSSALIFSLRYLYGDAEGRLMGEIAVLSSIRTQN